MGRQNMKFTTDANVARIRKIEELLTAQPRTAKDLAHEMGLSLGVCHNFTSHLRGQLHVSSWAPAGSWGFAPVYAWGEGKDAKRPQ